MSRLLTPSTRLVDALVDPSRRERTALVVLSAYSCVWVLYAVIAKSTQDLHFDMAEMVTLSRELDWGYAKHPPLGPWLVRAWFTVVPFTDGTYYLLASIATTVGLWFAWKVAGLYLDPQKRVLGLVMLMLIPFYNFHALKFNANTVLTPLWAATTWLFLQSLETRAVSYALLAGVAAGIAILAKYWSGVLIVGLFFAALSYPHRKEYFCSSGTMGHGRYGSACASASYRMACGPRFSDLCVCRGFANGPDLWERFAIRVFVSSRRWSLCRVSGADAIRG